MRAPEQLVNGSNLALRRLECATDDLKAAALLLHGLSGYISGRRNDFLPQSNPLLLAVIAKVAQYFSISAEAILLPDRTPRVVLARGAAMWLYRLFAGASYPELGRLFRRHHTSALYAITKIDAKRQQSATFAAWLDRTLVVLRNGRPRQQLFGEFTRK